MPHYLQATSDIRGSKVKPLFDFAKFMEFILSSWKISVFWDLCSSFGIVVLYYTTGTSLTFTINALKGKNAVQLHLSVHHTKPDKLARASKRRILKATIHALIEEAIINVTYIRIIRYMIEVKAKAPLLLYVRSSKQRNSNLQCDKKR